MRLAQNLQDFFGLLPLARFNPDSEWRLLEQKGISETHVFCGFLRGEKEALMHTPIYSSYVRGSETILLLYPSYPAFEKEFLRDCTAEPIAPSNLEGGIKRLRYVHFLTKDTIPTPFPF